MLCPVCRNVELRVSDRQGIEIDFCPQCRGVWLDRGELDKIIERSLNYASPHDDAPDLDTEFELEKPKRGASEHSYRREYDRRDEYEYERPEKRRKKGFLGDLFDIFD